MKKKTKKRRLYQQWQFWLMIVCMIAFISLIVTWDSELHFKIYENESGEFVEVDLDWKNNCLEMVEGKCFSPYYDGIEWLEENCECPEKNCEYVFNSSKRAVFNMEEPEKFTAKTYEGLIWFTTDEWGNEIAEYYEGDVELIEKCNPCEKYSCEENYIVEVWNQIK